jgi:sugar phosphate isomerase/epimerase
MSRQLLFGTTSYVLPDDIRPNVELLAPFVDDIELVLFEGEGSNLPTRAEVREFARMAQEGGCGFTVHLPLDVGIGEEDATLRRRGQEVCLRVIDLTLELEPHAFVVHPELPLRFHPKLGDPPQPPQLDAQTRAAWEVGLGESFGRMAAEVGPFPLAVENLQFPYEWVAPVVEHLDLGVVMDVGHLLLEGGVVAEHLRDYGHRLTVVHLHGIIDGRDHREVGAFPPHELRAMLDAMAATDSSKPAYRPSSKQSEDPALVVSLEVFGWKPTVPSLRTLAELFDGEAVAARLTSAADAISSVMESGAYPDDWS